MTYKTLLLAAFVAFPLFIFGQITGSSLSGTIQDEQGEYLVGATLLLQHLPTGTQYVASTNEQGAFTFADVRVGGPYSLKTNYLGFLPFEKNDLYLALGAKLQEQLVMQENTTALTEVVVAYSKANNQKGAANTIKREGIAKLPTLNNGIQDMTRTTPFANGNSFLGSSYRYNNLAIDGAANNDAFGFVEPAVGAGGSQAAGTPGSLARTQPISLDAIQELQVALAPFDVTLGNFTGGSINAVTRSGTNATTGAVYSFMKNQSLTGGSADSERARIETFADYLSGASVGGALVKNKLFYFANAEWNYRREPALFAAGSEGSAFKAEDINRIADTLRARYGYDAGSTGAQPLYTRNLKVFARLDWNLGDRHQLSLRHNFVDAEADHLTRSSNIFNFGSQGFSHFSTVNSTVLEWKTRFSERLHNKIIASHIFIDEHRATFGAPFPHIEINYGTAGNIFAGQYREAAIFRTQQRTIELTDNLSYFLGRHHITLGTHNEYYGINYFFVTPWNGRWAYSSVDNFLANKPSRIRKTYNIGDNSYNNNYNNPSAKYPVLLSAVYVQDDWSLFHNRLNLSMGLRLDGSIFLNPPKVGVSVLEVPEFEGFAQQLGNKFALAPRFGFNYSLDRGNRFNLRGGTGIFVGRMPFAWLSYPYIYDGNHYSNIDFRPASGTVVPLLSSDAELIQKQGNSKQEINLLDPNLRLPQVWRSSLALDARWGRGWSAGVEGIFTKTVQDIKFETRNLKPISVPLAPWDNRPYFSGERVSNNYTSVFVVKNTQKGYRYALSGNVRKTAEHWGASVAYTYGKSYDLANGVRVSPQANWEWNQTLDPNDPQLSYSNFDQRHRLVATADWNIKWGKRMNAVLSAVYIAGSGTPFTYTYAGDANRDGSPTNDLVYVPANFEESGLVDIKNSDGSIKLAATEQWANLERYIQNDAYLSTRKGQHTERNGGRTPWNQQIDLRIMQQFALRGSNRKIQISFDLINAGNLLNYRWGRQYFVPNTTNSGYSLLTLLKVEGGKPQYRFDNPSGKPYQYDPIASRSQGQLGIKLFF